MSFSSKAQTKSMTEGPIFPLIISFYFPLLAGNLFQQCYSLADTIIVGKGLGDYALAAVGASGVINFLLLGFLNGLTHGFSICFAQSYGADDMEKLRRQAAAASMICLISAAVFTLAALLAIRSIFVLMNTPEDILENALLYFRIILAGIPVTLFNNLLLTMMRSLGNSRTPLVSMTISSIINILMDLIFVFVCHMGVEGAAIATVIAQLCSALYAFGALRKYECLQGLFKNFHFTMKDATPLLAAGLPVGLMNSVTALGGTVLQTFVNDMGSACVAAYSACSKVASIFETFTGCVGLTMLTFTGQNKGAKKYRRIRTGIRQAIALTILINLPLAIMEVFFPAGLAKIMVSEPAVIARCCEYLPFTGVCLFPLGWLFVYRSSVQGLGNTTLPMLSGLLEVVCRVLIGNISKNYGFRGIAFAEVSAWVGAWLMLMIVFYILNNKEDRRSCK